MGMPGNQSLVAGAHGVTGDEANTVAVRVYSGEQIPSMRGEIERGKGGNGERRARRRGWGDCDGAGGLDGGVKAELPRG